MPPNPPKSSLLLHRINHTTTTTTTVTNHHAENNSILFVNPVVTTIPNTIAHYHTHPVSSNQLCSVVIQETTASISAVWSVVRRFDKPQAYKNFIKSCSLIGGDGDVGTVREVNLISGLPAARSTERLEILDEERHVISFSVVGGDHRLANYCSVTTLHPSAGDGSGTVIVESYVVDIPPENTKEDTRVFVDTIVRCNLQSLAQNAENIKQQKNNDHHKGCS
ncbi:abscisic acid receptor PYL4 [Trifolium pratense]|uniref:Abscisic acid receptor PYL4 n=1 Tax=Trifolium pratense TaxID=57577 RepID=A0A2K3LFZ2_TRIPR|nr:abscisic acid receptor PYL4 [Trifolium pratense]